MLSVRWGQEGLRVSAVTLGPKGTPARWGFKVYRETRDLSDPKAIRGLSDHKGIPDPWDLPVQKGNGEKRANGAPWENRALPECRAPRAN